METTAVARLTESYDVALFDGTREVAWQGYERQRASFVDGVLAELLEWPRLVSGEVLVTGVVIYQPGTDTMVRHMDCDRPIRLFSCMSPRFEAGAIVLPTEAEIERDRLAIKELAKALRGDRAFGPI